MITVREPQASLRGLLDFFWGDSYMDFVCASAAVRVWTCDLEKLCNNMTTGLCKGTSQVSAVQVDGWQASTSHRHTSHTMEEWAGQLIQTVMSGGVW